MTDYHIRFQGSEYLLIDCYEKGGGAITTQESFSNGECSFAHLVEDGRVMRFGTQIGSKEDIEFLGEAEDIGEPNVWNMLTHPSWTERGP